YEKAIRLARADISESEILKQNWWYEFKKAVTEIKKFGLNKILSLRFAQDNNTNILMLEFYISKLKELIRVRKDYDKSLEAVRNASWKKGFSQLKADHRKYLEEQNDFRYGWPWINENAGLPAPLKSYPKISILSPSFNSVGTIEKAILSVLNQGYPEFEHVICDAGSTDGTIEILKKYPHLKWVSEPDKGQSDAMNKAFRMSDGNIIAYLNVDDYFQRNAFYKIADAFEKDNSSDMVIGNLFFEYADHTFARVPDIEYKKIMLPFKYMFPINPVSYFYKREVQEKIGPFPIENHMTMDYWFLLKAYQNFKLQQIDAYLGTFCMNGYNKTSNANNRKNTHHRVLYHCWNFDRKNLPYYLYNYYKHFYYDQKPWNPGRIGNKIKKNLRRIHSILTLKKNKYYSQILFEKSRNRYFEKKRIRSIINILNSFIIYPKSLLYRSRQSQLIYSLLGADYSEKAKSAYFFLTTPPGLPLANKLHYYGNEFKNNNKIIKGNALLLLTYIISPKFIFKNKRTSSKKIKETFAVKPVSEFAPKNTLRKTIGFLRNKEYRETSYNLFNQAGERLYFHKNLQASILMFMSFIVSPSSIKKRSRRNLLTYSLLGDTITEKLKFAYHLYKDNPEYSLAHKLNYYGNELRKEYSTVKGNMILILAYVLSPKYISKREKVGKSNIVYASTQYVIPKKKISYKPKVIISNTANIFRDIRHSRDPAIMLKNFYLRSEYTVKSLFHYFKYRKYKAQSKELYTKAIESYNADRRMKVLTLILPSYILYPKSIINKNKFSLLVNSLLGKKMLRRLRRKG
ncbi:MAG: glycosyltransferase family 2 protein, partial [Ignavibacteria bacterium]